MKMIDKMNIIKINSVNQEDITDNVICEYSMTLIVNDIEIVTFMCSPDSLEYLAVGFLLSENIINYKEEYLGSIVDEKKGVVYVKIGKDINHKKNNRIIYTSGNKITSDKNITDRLTHIISRNDIRLNNKYLFNISKELDYKSLIFKKTGGTHSACLCDEKGMILFREDIGRHNALDKIIGEAFIKDITLDNKFIFFSGRVSSEMLLKLVRVGVSVIVSRSAPTDLAVKIARKSNITLVGFVRDNRMNIYSDEQRIICD